MCEEIIHFCQEPMDWEQLADFLGIDLNLIDPSTGTKLTPSPQGKECLGNGQHPEYECCCDECDYFLECFPEYV